jgi:hypothetical protein
MNTYRTICEDLKLLDAEQLDEVAAFVAGLLGEAERDEPAGDADHGGNGRRAAGGWVELKTINGSGPYAYRRWREGKRLRSKYIGKVDLGSNGGDLPRVTAP